MKSIIGVLAQVDDDGKHALLYDYVKAIYNAGGVPFIITYTEDREALECAVARCDGICFTGGVDVDPQYYGEAALPECGAIQPMRDTLELLVAHIALASGKPILGICRGAQLMNVAMGGSLYQDIVTQWEGVIPHAQTDRNGYFHSARVLNGTPLADLAGGGVIEINSFHHQALKRLAPGLQPMAYAPDGIVEAVYGTGEQYIRLYQWHPERLVGCDGIARRIFEDFILEAEKENN